MNRTWLVSILVLSLSLLALFKAKEVRSLQTFIKAERSIRINAFDQAKSGLSIADQELLELWESILTGRSAPLAKWMKEAYADLGLKHVFTPSGFHLTAVLSPILKFTKFHLFVLILSGGILTLLPGLGALKRMVLIKGSQKVFGTRFGFILAMLADVLIGTFTHMPLSFTYSFLFLGIIYSGARGLGLIFWFFTGQFLLCHFQATQISPLLILWGPVLNFLFSLAMPFLLLLAFPLWEWQLQTGLFILRSVQAIVSFAAKTLTYVPMWEIHIGMLLMLTLFLYQRKRSLVLCLLLICQSLNLDVRPPPAMGAYDFRPIGRFIEMKKNGAYFEDGRCKIDLIQGMVWERCTPKRKRRPVEMVSPRTPWMT
jgi:hypothetical protein